ncbi:ankyrin repeat-containing domain protein [Daldinia bambusicola]|nr:ankyrin repeat-containing domain protein [Daldinia bambusicola]
MAQVLLDGGADANARLSDCPQQKGGIALHVAVKKGNLEMIRILLNKGADINILDSFHNTPLDLGGNGYANGTSREEVFQALVDHDADINKDPAIAVAAAFGYETIVKMLIDRGANANTTNDIGGTPLSVAACLHGVSTIKKGEIVKILLDKGTDVKGLTPLQIAVASGWGHGRIVQMLRQKGAKDEQLNQSKKRKEPGGQYTEINKNAGLNVDCEERVQVGRELHDGVGPNEGSSMLCTNRRSAGTADENTPPGRMNIPRKSRWYHCTLLCLIMPWKILSKYT